jgi:hypothetical protein
VRRAALAINFSRVLFITRRRNRRKRAERRRINAALSAIDGQREARALAGEPQREASTFADLKSERLIERYRRQIETEAPILYLAELLGADADSEKAIRRLIALRVLCCDPLALTAAASARR